MVLERDDGLTPVEHDALIRLLTFARKHTAGGCKVFSLGDDCLCPLCDIERLYDALKERGDRDD
jgi:hypothetical protein